MADLVFSNLKTDMTNEVVIGALEVQVAYPDGRPCSGAGYELALSEGGTRTGTLDQQGRLSETNIPDGATGTLRITGAPVIALAE